VVTPLSPWKGEREQPSCVFLRSDVAPTGTARSAIQRLGTRTTQRVRFATARRAILPLPKGEGRGEGNSSPLKSNLELATLATARASAVGRLWARCDNQLWLGEPVELSLQNSSGRSGWLRLVPPHPCPLPRERERASCVFLKSGVAPTGTVRFATQRRDTCTTQRVGFATQRRAILPPRGMAGWSFLVCTRNCKAVTLTPHSAAAWVI